MLRDLHSGPYLSYEEFERVYDRVTKVLTTGLNPQEAQELGYLPDSFEPDSCKPHALSSIEMEQFGIQNGLTYDPGQWGMPHGFPVQGFGNYLNGRPRMPHPLWPASVSWMPILTFYDNPLHPRYIPRYSLY